MGANVKLWKKLKDSNLKQKDLAKLAGCDAALVSRCIYGTYRPSQRLAIVFANILECQFYELFDQDELSKSTRKH